MRRFDSCQAHLIEPRDQLAGLRRSSRARLISQPQPNALGVKRRGSPGFHHRLFIRATVGRRQSYGVQRNFPVLGGFVIPVLPIAAFRSVRPAQEKFASRGVAAVGLWRHAVVG